MAVIVGRIKPFTHSISKLYAVPVVAIVKAYNMDSASSKPI